MRDPFATPRRRPPHIPAGTSMLEEARIELARAARQREREAELEATRSQAQSPDVGDSSYDGDALKADDKVEAPTGVRPRIQRRADSNLASGKPASPHRGVEAT